MEFGSMVKWKRNEIIDKVYYYRPIIGGGSQLDL